MSDLPANGIQTINVLVSGTAAENLPGKMRIIRWSPSERRSRARHQTLRILGIAFCCILPGLFLHLLLLILIPLFLLTLLLLLPIYLRLAAQGTSFKDVDSKCPFCGKHQTLRPFLKTALHSRVAVQCADCGQISHAEVPEEHLN